MNYNYDGSVKNNLEKHQETSVTVFKKKEEGWDRLLEPLWFSEQKSFQRINTYHKSITISIALNHPIGDDKFCKIVKIEKGTVNGPTQVGKFKWEIEIVAQESGASCATVEVEVTDTK